jgi:hypothetical protein
VALVLIAVLAAENLADADTRTSVIADAAPTGTSRCPLTGMKNFLDAFAAVITQRSLSSKISEIRVSRRRPEASIKYSDGPGIVRTSAFSGPSAVRSSMRVEATLDRAGIQAIGKMVSEILLST